MNVLKWAHLFVAFIFSLDFLTEQECFWWANVRWPQPFLTALNNILMQNCACIPMGALTSRILRFCMVFCNCHRLTYYCTTNANALEQLETLGDICESYTATFPQRKPWKILKKRIQKNNYSEVKKKSEASQLNLRGLIDEFALRRAIGQHL